MNLQKKEDPALIDRNTLIKSAIEETSSRKDDHQMFLV